MAATDTLRDNNGTAKLTRAIGLATTAYYVNFIAVILNANLLVRAQPFTANLNLIPHRPFRRVQLNFAINYGKFSQAHYARAGVISGVNIIFAIMHILLTLPIGDFIGHNE